MKAILTTGALLWLAVAPLPALAQDAAGAADNAVVQGSPHGPQVTPQASSSEEPVQPSSEQPPPPPDTSSEPPPPTPTPEQLGTIAQQVGAVESMFLTTRRDDDFISSYPVRFADGLGGRWFISLLVNPADDFEAGARKVCNGQNYYIVDASDPFALRFTQWPGTDAQTLTIYASVGGDAYVASTDPANRAKALNKSMTDPSILDAMTEGGGLTNGVAQLLRPTPDTLAISLNNRPPRILARCPG